MYLPCVETLRCANCYCSPTPMSTRKTGGIIPSPTLLIQTCQNVYCCILFLIFCFIRQMTALHYSYGRLHQHLQHVELCKLLLSYGAEVDAKNQEYRPCPRIFDSNLSMLFDCTVFLKFFFDFLSDEHHSLFVILICCSISLGTTLHYAAQIGNVEMCKLLLSYDADVNARPALGCARFDYHHFSTSDDFLLCCISESSFLI